MGELHINDFSKQEIENTLKRYFSQQEIKSIINLVDLYNLKDRPRLIMACIKLSKGNYEELSSCLFHANDYCMEFITKAEKEEDYTEWVKSSILQ
jgi:hypothetical protein